MCSSYDDRGAGGLNEYCGEDCAALTGGAWTLHCLVVESEPVLRGRLVTVLQRGGHWATTAADRLEAVAYAGVGNFDAVLIGPHVAGASGEMLAADLRSHCPTSRILLLEDAHRELASAEPGAVDVHLSVAAPFLEDAILHELDAEHGEPEEVAGGAGQWLSLFR